MSSTHSYPQAHLLSLPLELREAIYEHLTCDRETLHLWDRQNALHLSATQTPPLALLQTHPLLYHEALSYFHRTKSVTLHVDAFAWACLKDTDVFLTALNQCNYLQHTRILDLRPTLNASIMFLIPAMEHAVQALVSLSELRKVVVSFAEAVGMSYRVSWRPWPYKGLALASLKSLSGHVEIEVGSAINPPRGTEEAENEGLRKHVQRAIE